jgi:hypothetical protein
MQLSKSGFLKNRLVQWWRCDKSDKKCTTTRVPLTTTNSPHNNLLAQLLAQQQPSQQQPPQQQPPQQQPSQLPLVTTTSTTTSTTITCLHNKLPLTTTSPHNNKTTSFRNKFLFPIKKTFPDPAYPTIFLAAHFQIPQNERVIFGLVPAPVGARILVCRARFARRRQHSSRIRAAS